VSPGGLRNTLPALGWLRGCVATRFCSSDLMVPIAALSSPGWKPKTAETNHSSAPPFNATWR
jgi:hypothetical protein